LFSIATTIAWERTGTGGAATGGLDPQPAAAHSATAVRTAAAFCASVPGMVKMSLVFPPLP